MIFYNVFSGHLTGKFREYYVKNLGDRKFNSLHSYWYFRNLPDEKVKEAFEITKGNIMIDSGAFTAYADDNMKRTKIDTKEQKKGKKKKEFNINEYIEDYINWINKWDSYVTCFGQMDVIPAGIIDENKIEECCQKTWENYLYMTSKMNNPKKLLYTIHCGEKLKWLKQALEYRFPDGSPMEYIAIGGLVGKSTKIRTQFLDECFRMIKASSNPNIKVHGFGVSSDKVWRKYPFESCDSFTPGMNANQGFTCEKGTTYRAPDYDLMFKPKGSTKEEQEELDRLEALKDPETLERENNDRVDRKTRLLIHNIEYWTNLGNEIKKTDNSFKTGLF